MNNIKDKLMKKTVFQLAIGLLSLLSMAGCSKSNDTINCQEESNCKATYKILKVDYQFYSIESQQTQKATALIMDIAKFMGYDLDDEREDIVIEGKSIEDCDAKAQKLFEQAAGMIDPNDYDGKYTVSLSRVTEDEGLQSIVEKTFVAEGDNSQKDDTSWDVEANMIKESGERLYVYDLAVAAAPKGDFGGANDARKLLERYGYEVIKSGKYDGDFNYWATIKPDFNIFIGYKCGRLSDLTDKDFACNVAYYDKEGNLKEHFVRQPYVFECVISGILVYKSNDGSKPEFFVGQWNTGSEDQTFVPFTKVGPATDGDLEQGEGADFSVYPYFSRHNLAIEDSRKVSAIDWLGYVRTHKKTTGQAFVNSVMIDNDGNVLPAETPQSLNTESYYNIYMGYEKSKVDIESINVNLIPLAIAEERDTVSGEAYYSNLKNLRPAFD